MYVRNSAKKRKYLIVKLFGTRSCDGSLYVCSCRYTGCINRRDVHIKRRDRQADDRIQIKRRESSNQVESQRERPSTTRILDERDQTLEEGLDDLETNN